jgi:hypothetical protein
VPAGNLPENGITEVSRPLAKQEIIFSFPNYFEVVV